MEAESTIRASRSDYPQITSNGAGDLGSPRLRNQDEAAHAALLSPSSIGNIIRIGLVFAIAFHAGYIVENYIYLDKHLASRTLPFLLADIAVAAGSIGLSYLPSVARRWRVLAMVDCLIFIAVLTWAGVIAGQITPLYTAVLSLIACTCVLLPWSIRWEGTVIVACLAAFGINGLLAARPDFYFGYHWLGLVTIAAIAYAGNAVWSRWRVAFSESQRHLRAELEALTRLTAERQKTEKLLRQSEAKLRKVFEASPDTICINRMSDGRFIDINREFLMTGYSKGETPAASPRSLAVWGDREQLEKFVTRLRTEGTVCNMEASFRRKDGRLWPGLISGALVELDGELCTVTVTRNIAKLKKTEHELIAAWETLRKLFGNSLDPITIARTSDHRIIDVNQGFTRALGFTREEALGKTTIELGLRVDEKRRRKFLEEVCRRGFAQDVEVEARCKGGKTCLYQISGVAIEIDGEPCIMTTGRDITRLKQTERDLIAARESALAASRAKSEFLSSMSHEIRTPMNAILGMADLLAETSLTPEQSRYVDIMTANGNVLLDLINAILDLAKMESGKLNLENTNFDLNELAERVADTLGIRAHEKHLELGVRILPDVPEHLVGDPLRLRQVLTNLIGNAIKFTQQGEVALTIENDLESKEPGSLRFTVSDTGIGIPRDRLETIFQSFSQVDSSTTRRYGGSGLGLAIVKRLVELMGGQIRVESEPGKGSTFQFTARFGVSASPVKSELVGPCGPERRSCPRGGRQ